MTAVETIRAVRDLGGSFEIKGDDLTIRVPADSLTDEQKADLRVRKPMLLEALREEARTDAELKRLDGTYGAVAIDSNEFGRVWLVFGKHGAEGIRGEVGTAYDVRMLAGLSPDEIRVMHRLRTIGGPGGSVVVKPSELNRSEFGRSGTLCQQ